ncbi:MAG: HAMP domain-containing histidine kinase [Geothrix sp.]|uniref:sensor histidine kinase n=1 Tax=Geothrix sp. TaxID=1962974 RepID=UPI0017A69245|nr:HAMP domain-containing sensor histidine kinase [Geothrix sp.]NWJ39809.1 HAMP domain-containing histidine kinase [Geothrix sp.]WIL22178.1 MAG: HAMP domain-containing histidine kinase [Geothrix sp.]
MGQFGLSGNARTVLFQTCLVVLSILALTLSALRARRGGHEALGWRLLSLSLLSNTLIQAVRILSFTGHPLPKVMQNVSILLQVVGSLLLFWTLLSWHLSPKTRFDRIRHGLDGLLFAIAVFFILWGLVLGPVFLGDRFPIADRFIWLTTFLVYDLLLGLAVFFGLTDPSRFRGPLGWLAVAFLLAALHNFKWLLDVLSGNPVFHFPAGPFIFLIPLVYLGAVLSPAPVGPATRPPDQAPAVHILPYVPVLGATVLGIWLLVTGTGPGHRLVLVWLALGLVLVLLIRQYLALKDFLTLSQQLESRVAERTRALEQAQALLLRTERMNSLATLGAGLAHDMNNMLSAIQSRAELVIMDLDEGKLPNRKDMLRVQEATQLAAALSGRLMALGRQDSEPPRLLDLGEELRAIQPLLQVLLPRGLTLRLDGSGPMPFHGTRGMLEQILVNLVGNARDAMPSGGVIMLRGRAPSPEEGPVGPLLEIEDTGTGIPEELQAQVFKPFFTTKAPGIGTGLGLASVKSLLEKAGGSIRFVSRAGRGTTFQVRLPYAAEDT